MVFVSWYMNNFLWADFLILQPWAEKCRVPFRETGKTFFWEIIRKAFFWEKIRIFFNIRARKFHFRKYNEFFLVGFLKVFLGLGWEVRQVVPIATVIFCFDLNSIKILSTYNFFLVCQFYHIFNTFYFTFNFIRIFFIGFSKRIVSRLAKTLVVIIL